MKKIENIIKANIKGVVSIECGYKNIHVHTKNAFAKVSRLEELKELAGVKDIEIAVNSDGLLSYTFEMSKNV